MTEINKISISKVLEGYYIEISVDNFKHTYGFYLLNMLLGKILQNIKELYEAKELTEEKIKSIINKK